MVEIYIKSFVAITIFFQVGLSNQFSIVKNDFSNKAFISNNETSGQFEKEIENILTDFDNLHISDENRKNINVANTVETDLPTIPSTTSEEEYDDYYNINVADASNETEVDDYDRLFENEDMDDTLIETTTSRSVPNKIIEDEIFNDPVTDYFNDILAHNKQSNSENDKYDDITRFDVMLSWENNSVITSPNYPEPYPTNQTIFWFLHGSGSGIELNITDLDINGANNDSLIIAPGETKDPSKALIFTYESKTEPRYRFLDVDSLFVRFKSNPGIAKSKGFSLSVKNVEPKKEEGKVPIANSSKVDNFKVNTYKICLGLTIKQFNDIKEDFRQLLAAMADHYIRLHDLDTGINSTLSTTKITNVSLCNTNWPDFVKCTEVKFAVGLIKYEDSQDGLTTEDLKDMWEELGHKEPYTSMMRDMDVDEFSQPDDEAFLTIWLLLGTAAFLCTILLSVVIWRSNCFEDYHRMGMYGETDSIHKDRKSLSLYPTPHQTLPPLYGDGWSDNDYFNCTDKAAYINSTFLEDSGDVDTFGINKKSNISPKDIYNL